MWPNAALASWLHDAGSAPHLSTSREDEAPIGQHSSVGTLFRAHSRRSINTLPRSAPKDLLSDLVPSVVHLFTLHQAQS